KKWYFDEYKLSAPCMLPPFLRDRMIPEFTFPSLASIFHLSRFEWGISLQTKYLAPCSTWCWGSDGWTGICSNKATSSEDRPIEAATWTWRVCGSKAPTQTMSKPPYAVAM